MTPIPVTSSNIHTIGYDPDKRHLQVTFKKSGTYTYHDVSPEKYSALMAADSKGQHLSKHIVGKHRAEYISGRKEG